MPALAVIIWIGLGAYAVLQLALISETSNRKVAAKRALLGTCAAIGCIYVGVRL
jgi:hypothetical protein